MSFVWCRMRFPLSRKWRLETAQTPLEQVYEPLDEHVSASVSGQLADAESEVLMALATPLSVGCWKIRSNVYCAAA